MYTRIETRSSGRRRASFLEPIHIELGVVIGRGVVISKRKSRSPDDRGRDKTCKLF